MGTGLMSGQKNCIFLLILQSQYEVTHYCTEGGTVRELGSNVYFSWDILKQYIMRNNVHDVLGNVFDFANSKWYLYL